MFTRTRVVSLVGAAAALVLIATPASASVPSECDPVRVAIHSVSGNADASGEVQLARYNASGVTNSSRGVGRATGGGLNNLRGKGQVQRPANREIRQDRSEVRRDKREVRQDSREIRQDRRDVRRDPTDKSARQELRQDKQDRRQDVRDLRQDRRDLRQDRRDQRQQATEGQQ
jgi:hypothetical protein